MRCDKGETYKYYFHVGLRYEDGSHASGYTSALMGLPWRANITIDNAIGPIFLNECLTK